MNGITEIIALTGSFAALIHSIVELLKVIRKNPEADSERTL